VVKEIEGERGIQSVEAGTGPGWFFSMLQIRASRGSKETLPCAVSQVYGKVIPGKTGRGRLG
jgi:hypothetical protein